MNSSVPLVETSVWAAAETHLLVDALWVVVEDDEVAVGHVETGQVVARSLGIVDVLIGNVRSATCLFGGASACMSGGSACS